MEKDWIKKAFDDCIDKVKIKTKLPLSAYCKVGKYPIISQEKELISGYRDCADDVISTPHPVTIFGDHTMVAKYINFDFVVGADGVKILQPKTFLNPRFFYYWVCSVNITSRGYARHYRYLRERNVEYPSSLDEQQRIVDILDKEFEKIDTLKANAEKGLQQVKDLFWKILQKNFKGEVCKLGDVLNLRRGHDLTHSDMQGGSIPVAGSGGVIGYHNVASLIEPCITVGRSGSVGKVYIYDKCWAHNTVLYVDDFKGNNPYYLTYLLISLDLSKEKSGCGVPTLNRNYLHPIKIGFDFNLQEQKKIVQTLDKLNEHCNTLQKNYEKTIALCDDMKQALLRKAFNGEF